MIVITETPDDCYHRNSWTRK